MYKERQMNQCMKHIYNRRVNATILAIAVFAFDIHDYQLSSVVHGNKYELTACSALYTHSTISICYYVILLYTKYPSKINFYSYI